MKLANVLRQECVVANAQLADKAEALRQVAQAAKKCPILKDVDEQEILRGLQEREKLGSTGFGKGIAIPHCRLDCLSDFVAGIISVASGVDFDALDGEKVRLIVFIVGPTGDANKHIRLLSAISRTLFIPDTVNEILAARTPQAMRQSFLRYTHANIDTKEQPHKNLVHVSVQNEKLFRDILEVLSLQSNSITVLDSENTGSYLAKMPLFADVLRDHPRKFSKTIIAVVEKGLTNETLRRIEGITGNLNERTDVSVTVQEVCCSFGSLSI